MALETAFEDGFDKVIKLARNLRLHLHLYAAVSQVAHPPRHFKSLGNMFAGGAEAYPLDATFKVNTTGNHRG